MVSHCSMDWYADRFSEDDLGSFPCMHLHVKVITCGSRDFVSGEVFDNIQEQVLCMDCGQYLSELEVLGVWQGETPPKEPNFQLDDACHDEM